MENNQSRRILLCLAGCAITVAAPMRAQDSVGHGIPIFGAIPYDGSVEDALAASAVGTTIRMSSFTFTASKDGRNYTDTIVGSNPFASSKTSVTIKVVIVPVIVTIGTTTFDPTVVDSCISGASTTPLAALQKSPIFKSVAFDGAGGAGHAATMNGIDVGTTTYPDAFRRAEFWSKVGGTKYHTRFSVTTLAPWTISAATVASLGGGNVLTTGCASLGVLNSSSLVNYISNTVIPSITGITPTTFAIFLMKDVVTTSSSSLNCLQGCVIGYHGAQGSPVQTYAVMDYDTTRGFWNSPGITDISICTHEVGEWMDDPLVTNPTPPWGGIGQVSGCQSNWEVGDPLTGTDFPAITMPDGVTYHPQELAFWSWYYNASNVPSIGAGGKFSSNGTFSGPSKACPPGGTY
jgi:hypothetical protein